MKEYEFHINKDATINGTSFKKGNQGIVTEEKKKIFEKYDVSLLPSRNIL